MAADIAINVLLPLMVISCSVADAVLPRRHHDIVLDPRADISGLIHFGKMARFAFNQSLDQTSIGATSIYKSGFDQRRSRRRDGM
jgi:hypothetical protein